MKKLESIETMRRATNSESRKQENNLYIERAMFESFVWFRLTGAQIRLYLWCELWSHEAETRKKPKPQLFPRDRWGNREGVHESDFYINFDKVKKCQLFNESNKTTFIRAKKRLIELGFIDCIVDGKEKPGSESSVYRLSERWKELSNEGTNESLSR